MNDVKNALLELYNTGSIVITSYKNGETEARIIKYFVRDHTSINGPKCTMATLRIFQPCDGVKAIFIKRKCTLHVDIFLGQPWVVGYCLMKLGSGSSHSSLSAM